jgi:hypothetical protein
VESAQTEPAGAWGTVPAPGPNSTRRVGHPPRVNRVETDLWGKAAAVAPHRVRAAVAERVARVDAVEPAGLVGLEAVRALVFSRTSQPSFSSCVPFAQRMPAEGAKARADSSDRPTEIVGAAVEPTRARADTAAMAELGAEEVGVPAVFRPGLCGPAPHRRWTGCPLGA